MGIIINGCLIQFFNISQLFVYFEKVSKFQERFYCGMMPVCLTLVAYLFGVPRSRLLGNSSFHVVQQEDVYSRNKDFPYIPLICSDQQFKKIYVSLQQSNPKDKKIIDQNLYNFTYGIIKMSDIKENGQLPIEYWHFPAYYDSQTNKDWQKFNQKCYHIDQLQTKQMLHQKNQKNLITNNKQVILRSQIGGFLKVKFSLLRDSIYISIQQQRKNIQENCKKTVLPNPNIIVQCNTQQIQHQSKICLKVKNKKQSYYIAIKNDNLSLQKQKFQWKLQKNFYIQKQNKIKIYDTFQLSSTIKGAKKYLMIKGSSTQLIIEQKKPIIKQKKPISEQNQPQMLSLWMFEQKIQNK